MVQVRGGKQRVGFIEPMLALSTETLPEGKNWSYELKLDGYRALGLKSAGKVEVLSRNNKDLTAKFPHIAKGLLSLPDATIVDGELVALDKDGSPSFNLLQNFRSAASSILYFVFDLPLFTGQASHAVRFAREIAATLAQ